MSQCVREGIIKEIKATGKSYRIAPDATEVFIPITSYRDRDTTYNIAKRLHDKATAIFGKFGRNTSLNTTYSDGIAVNIHPTPQLIRAYDIKNSKERERKEEEEARKSVWDREGSLGIDEFGDSNPTYRFDSEHTVIPDDFDNESIPEKTC